MLFDLPDGSQIGPKCGSHDTNCTCSFQPHPSLWLCYCFASLGQELTASLARLAARCPMGFAGDAELCVEAVSNANLHD
jgi:hypothetical protein